MNMNMKKIFKQENILMLIVISLMIILIIRVILQKPTEGFQQNSDLLNSFVETDKLCRALELNDEIKNERSRLGKNKIYLAKLEEQEVEISRLTKLINDLEKQNLDRQKTDEIYTLSKYQKQKEEEAKVKDLVEQRLDSQKKLDLNINLTPYRK